jgi:hypothetical protein
VNQFNAALNFYANIPSFNAIKQDLTGVGDSCSEDEVGDTAQVALPTK